MSDKIDIGDDAAEDKMAQLDILRQSLDDCRAKAAEQLDQLLRLKAEFDNFRKRSEREKADVRRWGKEEVLIRLIGVMDVMEQAEAAAHDSADLKSVTAGLDMLYKEFKRLLKEEGVEEIPAADQKFDPGRHEAVEIVEDDGEENRVLAVLKRGYSLDSAVIRPALVRVSKNR
jgi:molecular chaperone GrpE